MARTKKYPVEKDPNDPSPPEAMKAKGRFDTLRSLAYPYLMRGRESAKYTIPSLLPLEGATGSTIFYTPFQSVGAEGVNNLASKLLLALFPPGQSWFRLTMDDFVVEALEAKAGAGQEGDARAEFESALAKVERAVINRMEQVGARTALFEGFKQLIVAGNVLFYVGKRGAVQYYRLDKYVVKRDVEGNVVDIVVKDLLSYATLSPEVRAIVDSDKTTLNKNKSIDNVVEVYTRITRDGPNKRWTVHQEVADVVVPESEGTYPLDKCPWIAARWSRVDGEDYGRGRCEEFIGDLQSCDKLTQCIIEFAAAASKILFFMEPGGTTDKKRVSRAPSGAFLNGSAKDISTLQLDKVQDFRVCSEVVDKLTKRLERAFLLVAGSQREAERVTAEEIRLVAQELESSLGGVYSILAQEVQRPLATRVMFEMQNEDALPKLPEKAVSPQIITGLEALGRGSDLQKLEQLFTITAQVFGPQVTAEYINVGSAIKRIGTSLSIPTEGLIKSDEDVQTARDQQAQQSLNEKTMPVAIKAQNDLQRRDIRGSTQANPGLTES